MLGIPPAKDTDAEDVAWGLQTAEALWKRGERIDAVVWLRRAAQAAAEASADDRALELARSAAELSDWMAMQMSAPPPQVTAPPPPGQLTVIPGVGDGLAGRPAPPYNPHDAPTFVPHDEGDMQGGPHSVEVSVESQPTAQAPVVAHFPTPRPPSRPSPPANHPPSSPTMQTAGPVFGDEAPPSFEPHSEDAPSSRTSTSVPPAEMVHAGMFNPWDENAVPSAPAVPPLPPPPAARFAPEEEEIITSVRPQQLAQQQQAEQQHEDALAAALGLPKAAASVAPMPAAAPAAPATPSAAPPRPGPSRPQPPRPPPLPPRAMKPKPPAPVAVPPSAAADIAPVSDEVVTSAASVRSDVTPAARSDRPPRITPPPPSPTQVMAHPASSPPEPAARPASAPPAAVAEQPAPGAPERLDLDNVDAFADLPDDARIAFAAAAQVSVLGEGEEVSSFALAYILSGSVDVAATMVDAAAARLEGGAVLRSRGTTDEGVPMRLIGVASGIVATWTDAAVQEAFRTCPWVEEDLRTAADRIQTSVGVTIGPLGERLDAAIREEIIGKLTMRTLAPGDIVVTAGEQMPGLLLVGVGQLELVDGERVTGSVGSGEFVFPTEVLGGGDAPFTARAGAGGALILFGDRRIAQELMVTCPPLLEVFAGM